MFSRRMDRGFTLVEVLAAIALFTIGAIAVARMQTISTRSATFSREALAATTAAQTLIEQLKDPALAVSFPTVLAGGGPCPVRPDSTPTNIQAGTGGVQSQLIPGMTIQWTATNTVGTTGTRYTTITVKVQWAGNTRNYTASTVISES